MKKPTNMVKGSEEAKKWMAYIRSKTKKEKEKENTKKKTSPAKKTSHVKTPKTSPVKTPKTSPVKTSPVKTPKTSPVKTSPVKTPKTSPVKTSPVKTPKTSPVKTSPVKTPKTKSSEFKAKILVSKTSSPNKSPKPGKPKLHLPILTDSDLLKIEEKGKAVPSLYVYRPPASLVEEYMTEMSIGDLNIFQFPHLFSMS